MADTGTYGQADLLIAVNEVKVWTAPVAALGPTMLVSLVIDAGDHLATDPSVRPAVSLAVRDPNGEWASCRTLAGGGGGADAAVVRYATFARPAPDLPPVVRLEVRYRGETAVREMVLGDVANGTSGQ